jgi:hypothetical protein
LKERLLMCMLVLCFEKVDCFNFRCSFVPFWYHLVILLFFAFLFVCSACCSTFNLVLHLCACT